MVPTINEEFTLCIILWNSMLIKLRLQCIGNVCCVLVYSQSVYSTQLCVHTEQWIHNFGLTKKKKKKKKKNAPWRANFREPRSTALYPNPRYNEARYNEGRQKSTMPKKQRKTKDIVRMMWSDCGGLDCGVWDEQQKIG